MKKGEEIKYELVVINSHGDVKYSIGNRVKNIVVTICMVPGWVLEILGE